MTEIAVKRDTPLKKRIRMPGDKSISHRSLMFAGLADGESTIRGLQGGLDVRATYNCIKALGIEIIEENGSLRVMGKGTQGFSEPEDYLDCLNSGTTMRLMSAIVAGQPFLSILTGDRHLRKRPMARVLDPLREMGALALGRAEDRLAPLVIRGGTLRAIDWTMEVASAQVKSAVLLAGLNARGVTWVTEPKATRDHTERMLTSMGVEILREGETRVGIRGGAKLKPTDMTVPGDPSSAAFLIAAAIAVPGSKVTVEGVSLNPYRTGFFRLLERMGANVTMTETHSAMGEPVGDITAEYCELKGIEVTEDEVPSAIDEFPIFCVMAALAKGESVVRGAAELRHKESDRIDAMAKELRKAGVEVETFADGMKITGGKKLTPANFDSHGDHRLAMSLGVLSLAIQGGGIIHDPASAEVSYPGFWLELMGD